MDAATAAARVGRIGPNAITRVAQALTQREGAPAARQLFERAGLLHHLQQPPQQMVDEAEVLRLHAALRQGRGREDAAAIAHAAGRLTAAYLLAHRIPKPLQAVLRHTPARMAARVLLAAIRRNAWTFVGSGRFSAEVAGAGQRLAVLHVRDNPLCRGLSSPQPGCDFYAATFEGLFAALVHPQARALEVACAGCGDAECRFELRW